MAKKKATPEPEIDASDPLEKMEYIDMLRIFRFEPRNALLQGEAGDHFQRVMLRKQESHTPDARRMISEELGFKNGR